QSFTLPAPTETHTLSLHDALPISARRRAQPRRRRTRGGVSARGATASRRGGGCRRGSIATCRTPAAIRRCTRTRARRRPRRRPRSEEHTSELQSPYDLVCRLLLEK